jgi:tetratricopeptide (TPR) repeat protein
MKSIFIAATLVLLFTAPAAPQGGSVTESMGRYHSAEEKAIQAYSRGLGLKRKAEQETDLAKKTKLYEKAKDELAKSVGYVPNYDGYLALGQVYLALGKRDSALNVCVQAQSLKPSDQPAKSCIEEARKPPEKVDAQQAKQDGGR